MFAIIFVLVTIVLTTVFYKTEQSSLNRDLFFCFLMSLSVQVTFVGLVYLIYALYMLKPL